MFVGREVVDVPSEMAKDDVEVLAVDATNLLNFLNDIITETILDELIESHGRIFQQIVQKAHFFMHRHRVLLQPLLDKPRALLVLTTKQFTALDYIQVQVLFVPLEHLVDVLNFTFFILLIVR